MPDPTVTPEWEALQAEPTTQPTISPATLAPPDGPAYKVTDLFRALTPALVAIVLAIITRQVVVALSAGILVAAVMMQGLQGSYNPIGWITFAVDRYVFEVLAPLDKGAVDYSHLKILVFTFFIGAMVGVIEANGGTRAVVARVTRRIKTRQSGQMGGFLAGMVVFFDDYANAMIVGPSMRPIFDRLRLSREKLAYIVDSTAAPVSSIFIGTWLAAEIGYLDDGFDAIKGHLPAFLDGVDGTKAFWASIPYRTYALLALVMVFLVAVTGRDFGSMRKAESRAAAARSRSQKSGTGAGPVFSHRPEVCATGGLGPGSNELGPVENAEERVETGQGWWLGAVPVLVLVGMVLGLLVYTGWRHCVAEEVTLAWGSVGGIGGNIKTILGKADSYPALVYGSLAAACVAVATSVISRALTLAETIEAAVSGMSRMFAACIVLVLAWGLSQGGKDLHLGEVATVFLQEQVDRGVLSVTFVPLAVFVTAAFVSFATGTSWGTMAILCPTVIPICAGVLASLPVEQALPLFYAAVGAVLTGAVFGDHCSPISDTTVLSSIASECDLSKHVWTQMPYALTVAVAGIVCTDGLGYALSRWAPEFYQAYRPLSCAYGLVSGALLLLLILLVFGRRPKTVMTEPTAESGV